MFNIDWSKLRERVSRWWEELKEGWGLLSTGQKIYSSMGAGIVVIGALVGGPLMQAVFTGLIFNSLLWMMFYESTFWMLLMTKYGAAIDRIVTLAGFFFGGSGAVTSLMVAVVVGALFSVFRVIFCAIHEVREAELDAEDAEAEEASRDEAGGSQ